MIDPRNRARLVAALAVAWLAPWALLLAVEGRAAAASPPSCATLPLSAATREGDAYSVFYDFAPVSCVFDSASVAYFFPDGIATMGSDRVVSVETGAGSWQAVTAADACDVADAGGVPGWPLDPADCGWSDTTGDLLGRSVTALEFFDAGATDADGRVGPASDSGGVGAPGYVTVLGRPGGGGPAAAGPVWDSSAALGRAAQALTGPGSAVPLVAGAVCGGGLLVAWLRRVF